MKVKECVGIFGIIALLGFCLLGCGVPLQLLFAWAYFLYRTIPEMRPEWPAIAASAAALVLLTAVVHGLAGWLYRSSASADDRRPWRLRWTLAGVFSLLAVFAASIAMIGMVHELGWLVTADEPVMSSGYEAARRAQSSNNLKQIGLGMHNYHDTEERLPPGGTFDRYGEPLHSWETYLLPYIGHKSIQPDLSLPWNHPKNAEHFRTVLPELLHPAFQKEEERVNPDRYALSHYAVNRRVMHDNFSIRFDDVTDGTSNTILAGEVRGNFRPWGDPINWRDPALGINRSPDGFGGPPATNNGCQFSLMDGSVRFIFEEVDPQVLKALATPAGGENVPVP